MSTDSLENGFLYKIIDRTIGVEHFIEFRSTFEEIVVNKYAKFNRWDPNERQIKKEALDAAKKARQSDWDKVSFFISLLTVVLSLFIQFVPWLISVVSLVLSAIFLLRRTAVEILLFPNPYEYHRPERVKFVYSWNVSMIGLTSLAIMPIVILSRFFPRGYVLGMWAISDIVEEKEYQ